MKRTLALLLALMLLVSGAAFAEELTLKVANPDLFPVTTEAGAELGADRLGSPAGLRRGL